MLRKPFWQRITDRIPCELSSSVADVGTTVRQLDLAALEPRLLFSAGPIPIDGDVALDDAAGGADAPILLAELPPIVSTEPGVTDQPASLDANKPLAVDEGGEATIDSNGNWVYRPVADFNGADSFKVEVTDDDGNVESHVIGLLVELPHVDSTQPVNEENDYEVAPIIDVAAVNAAPVLSDAVVTLDPVAEGAGSPVGAVGTLISDLVDLSPSSQSVERTDVVPYYSASGGNIAQRSINWWWGGWDDWATKVKVSLEQHGSFWMHLPYGTIGVTPMDFDGQSDAANGVTGVHGPLPHIAEGLEHYLEQVVTPDDELFFYFGAPSTIYTTGMTYADYELAVLAELDDVLGLADNAKVSLGFDATYGQPTSLGGIWTVLGGPTGYNAQVLQKIASFGVNIILEPWIYQGATWAYDYDTIYTDRFYRSQDLDEGAIPRSSHIYESAALLTGDHYRLPFQSEVDLYYGGSWETAVVEIRAAGDVPLTLMLNDGSSLFENAWVEFADDVIDPSTLVPLPGYDPPGSLSLDEFTLVGDFGFSTLFAAAPEESSLESNSVMVGEELAPAALFDNVFDADSLLTGIAITSADTTNGTWWYSTDGGQSWDGLGSVSSSSARLFAANSLTRIYFEPNPDYSGDAANGFTFQAWDRSDNTDNGTSGVDVSSGGGTSAFSAASDFAAVSVTSVNDAPTINSVPDQVVSEDDVLGPIALTVGDIDTPLASLNVTATSSDQAIVPNGNILITGTGADRWLTITPAPNQHGGPVSITVTVSDGELEAAQQFNVVVTPQQDVPQVSDDFFVVFANDSLSVPSPGPLDNDVDLDGDPLTMVVVLEPQHGTLLRQPDGSFSYTPAIGFVGADLFQYVAHDGLTSSNVATVRILVQSDLAPPPPAVVLPTDADRLGENALSDDREAESLQVEDSPIDETALALTTAQRPLPETVRGHLARAPIGLEQPPASEQQPPSDKPATDALLVPRLSNPQTPLPHDGNESPDQPASDLVEAQAGSLQLLADTGAKPDVGGELNEPGGHNEDLQQLVGDVALGVSSTLTAGYMLWLAHSHSLLSSTLARIPGLKFLDPLSEPADLDE